VEIKYKIWLEKNGAVLFGEGRKELLEAIDECGSLSAAAKKLNMSYRAAWGRLNASEKRLGIKLIEVDSRMKGMHLTSEAKVLLNKFNKLEKKTYSFLEKTIRKLSLLTESTTNVVEKDL